ncbi:hypothetical protein ILUMI_12467 [Ignelater luminosus]|uniref:Uncharacterized protein n=1 Tax=Ignelater luminosus TaxID=2038154 RepID=A0A8K0D0A4_IGNLU|nr:hypothetical protein ILUMI_12467 [Ignelater luminosus]
MEGHEKLYRLVVIGETFVIPLSELFLCSLDCMYLGFCAKIVIQFRILSQYLEELTVDGTTVNEMKMNRLGKIKNFLLCNTLFSRFVKEFRQAFSLVLLNEFVIDGPLICAELLAAFESRSYQTQARHVVVFTFVTLQLAFFCIPANHIANEHIPSLKVPLLLIIQSSQKEITLKAGDLVTINAGTIVNVSAQGRMVRMFSSERIRAELNNAYGYYNENVALIFKVMVLIRRAMLVNSSF